MCTFCSEVCIRPDYACCDGCELCPEELECEAQQDTEGDNL